MLNNLNNLNKSLPKELRDLQMKQALEEASKQVKDDKSSTDVEDNVVNVDPVDGKALNKVADKITAVKSIEAVPISSDPLDNIGKFTRDKYQSTTVKPLGIDLDEYAPYFGGNTGWISSTDVANKARAINQSNTEQFLNATIRVVNGVGYEIAGQIGNIADVEDYANSDAEIGNWLNTWAQRQQAEIDKANPIYRENPDTPLDLGDAAWWFENGASLTKSAIAFGVIGAATGVGVGAVLGRGAKVLNWLQNLKKEAGIVDAVADLAYTAKVVDRGTNLATTYLLNQAEGIAGGIEARNKVFEETMAKLDQEQPGLSYEEKEKIANREGARAGASAVSFNRLTMLLNLSSTSLLLKAIGQPTGQAVASKGLKTLGKELLSEGAQEYGEELINEISVQQATDKEYTFKKALDYTLSAQGFETGLLGFIGGAGQTALTKSGHYIPAFKNRAYNQAFNSAYNHPSIANLSESERTAKAKETALKLSGLTQEPIFKPRDIKGAEKTEEELSKLSQQEQLINYATKSVLDRATDTNIGLNQSAETVELMEQLKLAKEQGNSALADELEQQLQTSQVFHTLDTTGSVTNYKSIYTNIEQLSHEEAADKGYYTEGDENTPHYYKAEAKEKLQEIESLERIHNESKAYINSVDIRATEAAKYYNGVTKNKITKQIAPYIAELASSILETNPDIKVNFDINSKSQPGYKNLSTYVAEELKQKPSQTLETINAGLKSLAVLNKLDKELTDNLDAKKSKEYQKGLQEEIKQSNEQKAKEEQLAKDKANQEEAAKQAIIQNENKEQEVEQAVINNTEVVAPVIDRSKIILNNTLNVSYPTTGLKEFDLGLQELSNLVASKNFYAEGTLNFLKEKREGLIKVHSQFPDLIEQTKFNEIIRIVNQSIEFVENDIEAQLNPVEVVTENTPIREKIGTLFDDLESDTQEQDVEENQSPLSRPDFSKSEQRIAMFKDILNDMNDLGYDYTDFRTVIQFIHDQSTTARVIKNFDSLKNLFNVVMDTNIEGTYRDIMFTTEQQRTAVDAYNEVAKYSIPDGTYTHMLDDIARTKLEQLRQIAIANNFHVGNNVMSLKIYNDTASNLLAYLAKQYSIAFEFKVTADGLPYLTVDKTDISNLLNSKLDQRVLDPDVFIPGTKIEFVALDSYVNDEGETILAESLINDEKPIGIIANGTLVEGLYLHNTGWINGENVNNTKEGITQDQNQLRLLRTLILTNPNQVFSTVITKRTPGVPIENIEGYKTVTENMPNVEVGIVKDGKVYVGAQAVVGTINNTEILDGRGVVIIPFGAGKLALPTKRADLPLTHKYSIVKAVDLFLRGTSNDTTKQLDNEYNFNILEPKGLERYINSFIHLTNVKVKNAKEYESYLGTIPSNVFLTQMQYFGKTSNDIEIYAGSGLGTPLVLSKGKYKNLTEEQKEEQITNDLRALKSHLDNLFAHINLDYLGTDTKLPIIERSGQVGHTFDTYNDFAKAHMLTSYMSMKLDNGKDIYTIQGRINFDMEQAVKLNLTPVAAVNPVPTPTVTRKIKIGNTYKEKEVPVSTLFDEENLQKPITALVENTDANIILPSSPVDTTNTINPNDSIITNNLGVINTSELDRQIEEQGIDLENIDNLYSPAIEIIEEGFPVDRVNIDQLQETSSLINGIPPSTQTAFIRTTINNIKTKLRTNPESEYEIYKEIDAILDGLKEVRDRRAEEKSKYLPLIERILARLGNREAKQKLYKGIYTELVKGTRLRKVNNTNKGVELGLTQVNIDNLRDIEEEETNDDVSLEIGENNEKVFETPFTLDPSTGLTQEVKSWLEGFVKEKVSNRDDVITSLLGLGNYIPFTEVYNDLLTILSKSKNHTGYVPTNISLTTKYNTPDKIQPPYIIYTLSRLEQFLETKPYLKQVMRKLQHADLQQQNQFITAFNVTHTNSLVTLAVKEEGARDEMGMKVEDDTWSIRPIEASSTNISGLVLSEWSNNLEVMGIVDNTINGKLINQSTINNFNLFFSGLQTGTIDPSPDNLDKWLKTIGIELSPSLLVKLVQYGLGSQDTKLSINQLFNLKGGVFYNIAERVNRFSASAISPLSLEYNSLFDDSAFRDLARIEGNYRRDLFTKSYKNSNGDTVYGFTNEKRVIEQGLQLLSDEELLTRLSNDTFSSGSSWLNQLFGGGFINTNSYFYQYFNHGVSDGLRADMTKKGIVVDSLEKGQLTAYALGLFYNGGLAVGKSGNKTPIIRVMFPTLSDKAANIIYQVPGKVYRYEKIFENGYEVDKQFREADLLELAKNLFYPELNRILKHQAGQHDIKIAEWVAGGGKMLMFPHLNKYHDLFINREVETDKYGNSVIIKEGQLRTDVTTNPSYYPSLIAAAEQLLLEEMKTNKEAWIEANIIRTDGQERLDYIDERFAENMGIRDIDSVLYNYTANTLVANMNFQQLFIGDIALFTQTKSINKSLDQLVKDTQDNLGKRLAMFSAGKTPYNINTPFNVLVLEDNRIQSNAYEGIKNLLVNRFGKEKGEQKAREYVSLTASDAQEYISLSEYLDILVGEGEISSKERANLLEQYNRTGKVSSDLLKIILQPMKPVYTGTFTRDKINSNLYIKSSAVPLIKEFTKGTELDKIRQLLDNPKLNIQRVAFKSAVKVGLPTTLANPFKDGGLTIDFSGIDLEKSIIRNVPRKGHGKQNNVPYSEEKQNINDGTQQSKLYLTNLLDVDGFIDPTKKEGFNKVTGRELNDSYLKTYESLFILKANQLMKELEIDPETKAIGNLTRLNEILQEEGIARSYNTNDLLALQINPQTNMFEVPLWLNNNDTKIAALLNSIVDNRVRKRKVKGKSFVLMSPTGLHSISKANGMVFAPDFDGNLKSTYDNNGNLIGTTVFIPFKYWDNNGKPLKLEDFQTNGVIDTNKLPKELLESFGYRIPTSGINLMSNITIGGFLPKEMGDIVIAPADFIAQMGSDFDVDKLYASMYNTYYDIRTGTLSKLKSNHISSIGKAIDFINEKLKAIKVPVATKESLDAFKEWEESEPIAETEEEANSITFSRKVNEWKKTKPELKSTHGITDVRDYNRVYRMWSNAKAALKSGYGGTVKNAQEKLLQNTLLDIHRAVLNNPDPRVQSAKVNPLSFGDLPALAERFYSEPEETAPTVVKASYQLRKYLSARSGKAAVGIFSLNTVFNGVLQHVKDKMYFYNIVEEEIEGKAVRVRKNISYFIAGKRSNALNDIEVVGETIKYKSEVHEAFMAAALDNEKEQLLGKLNINNHTFDFIRGAIQLGFDEELIISIINQPVIKKLVENAGQFIGTERVPFDENQEALTALLTLEELQDYIENEFLVDITSQPQQTVLSFFQEISSRGGELKTLQSAANADSAGIGKNMFYSIKKVEQLFDLSKTVRITNAMKVIGDIQVPSLPEEKQELLDKNYYNYNGVFIKPSSLGGLASVYGTMLNVQLWNRYFPYSSGLVAGILKSTNLYRNGVSTRNTTITQQAKNLQESVTNFKSFLISDTLKLFGGYNSILEARKDLLFNSETKLSLANIILDLRKTGKLTNSLLDRLDVDKTAGIVNPNLPQLINYYNATGKEFDEEIIIRDFTNMLSSKESLGTYNGVEYTPQLLAHKLILSQLVSGGIQRNTQVIKYIPFNFLQQIGYFKTLEENSVNITNNTSEDGISPFYIQTVQHFPEEYFSGIVQDLVKIEMNGIALVDPSVDRPILVTQKKGLGYNIYLKHGGGIYKQIDNLGYKGMMEWDATSTGAGKSSIPMNQALEGKLSDITEALPETASEIETFLLQNRDTEINESPKVYNKNTISPADELLLNDYTSSLESKYANILQSTINTNSNPILVEMAKQMLPIVGALKNIPLYVNKDLKAKGVTKAYKSTGEVFRIEVNPNQINNLAELQEVLIEEMVHALLKSDLREASAFKMDVSSLMQEVLDKVVNTEEAKQAYEEMKRRVTSKLPLRPGIERDLYYNLYNLDEFVAAAIKDKEFQKVLSGIESKYSNKSLWTKFVEAIKAVLVKLGLKDNTVLTNVLEATLNKFSEINSKLQKELSVPTYIRSIEYLNTRFNLRDEKASPLLKANAKEIADFINTHIVNVIATVKDGYVQLEPAGLKDFLVESNFSTNVYQDFEDDFMFMGEDILGASKVNPIASSLKQYIANANNRIDQLKKALVEAETTSDFKRLAEIKERLNKEEDKLAELQDVVSMELLYEQGLADLSLVNDMVGREMNSEDILYVKSVLNYWKDVQHHSFTEDHKTKPKLVEMFGKLENQAKQLDDKVVSIMKNYLETIIKGRYGKAVTLDDVFENFKDINLASAQFRDISQYDNVLTRAIWAEIKEANIKTVDESSTRLEEIEEQVQKIIPILKGLGTKELFNVFRQKSPRGKETMHLVKPYSSSFFKDKNKLVRKLFKDKKGAAYIEYLNWIAANARPVDLSSVFPPNKNISPKVVEARESLKASMGEGLYEVWFSEQEKKLEKYQNEHAGVIEYYKSKFNIASKDKLSTNPNAEASYLNWLRHNSPYEMSQHIKGTKTPVIEQKYNNYKYYAISPIHPNYIDNDFQTISSNPELYKFYKMFSELIKELELVLPTEQRKTLAFGGIPAISKGLIELYSERGLELGFLPIKDMLAKSIASSFNSSPVSKLDWSTMEPQKDMRVPIIQDNYKEIQDYVTRKSIQYQLENKVKETPESKLKEFEEDIIDRIAQENTFDLGKIAKVFYTLTTAHKHKAKIEDMIKIANNVIDSYQEVNTRPDGSPIVLPGGIVDRKSKSESFINFKGSLKAWENNIFYGDVKKEEGHFGKILTPKEKQTKAELEDMIKSINTELDNGSTDGGLISLRSKLQEQLSELGSQKVASKVGDNFLKWLQLKLMGWNALGAVGNMSFGYIANVIEAAGGQHFTRKDLNYAYKLAGSSVAKNLTFNLVESETATKIRSMMDNMDILKDSSYELYTNSVRGVTATKLKFLSPFNLSQRAEYLNQAPIMIALFRNTKYTTPNGKTTNLYDGFTKEGTWNTAEFGEAPTALINKTRIKLDKLIMQLHGNYDNMSPQQAKRVFLGRAVSQFRTFLTEAIATRVETERFDENLESWVKGRYRSVLDVYQNTEVKDMSLATAKGVIKQLSFGLLFKKHDFSELLSGNQLKDIDIVNMRKIAKEISFIITTNLFLLSLRALAGDDEEDENGITNVLINQGTRIRTDLLLYINPNEYKKLVKDIIPVLTLFDDADRWTKAVYKLSQGEDTIESGVHSGDSYLATTVFKTIPGFSKGYSIYNSSSQIFDK